MIEVGLHAENDLAEWRGHARRLLMAGVPPEDVVWRTPSDPARTLFADEDPALPDRSATRPPRVPRAFLDMTRRVLCHRDAARFDRLYRLLWRLQTTPALLRNSVDDDVAWMRAAEKAIARDCHKMKAFVRFREAPSSRPREAFIAWFEPDHRIVSLTAPFFMRRFTGMDWTILTPDESARWDGDTLMLGDGAAQDQAPAFDAVEDQWKAYFASIFNPARVKIAAMTSEMPKKYWKNLPEAALIPDLIAGAEGQVKEMQARAIEDRRARQSSSAS